MSAPTRNMFENLNCIALRTVKYSDSKSILTAFSRQHGRIGLLLPASNTPAAARQRALALPMSRFDCTVDIKPGRSLHSMRDMRRAGLMPSASPVKGALSMFAADLLSSLLREPQADEHLWRFLETWIDELTEAGPKATANMHICFIIRLMHFLGIEPDWSTFSQGCVFDMNDGIFRIVPPLHNRFINPPEAEAAYRLRRITATNAKAFAMGRSDRNTILDRLIQYYQIHFPTLGTLNSLSVLRTLFDF